MRRGESRRLLAWLVVFAQAIPLAGCHEKISGLSGSASQASASGNLIAGVLGSNDLGVAVFNAYRSTLQKTQDPAVQKAKLAALDKRRADFVKAVNDTANAKSLQNGLVTAEDLFKLVDDGTIPGLAEDAAQILELLLADQAAQNAIVQLVQAGVGQHAQVPIDDFVSLLGRMCNYPDTEQLWTAASDIIQQNPGLCRELLEVGSERLRNAQVPTQTPAGLAQVIPAITQALLDPAQVRGGASFGQPEWVVKIDANGQPVVKSTSASGVVYDTFDAKGTVLALFAKMGGDFLRAGTHNHGMPCVEAALGPRQPNGTFADGPVVDLVHGGLELLVPDDAPRTLRAVASLLQNDPARAERILAGFGRAIDKARIAQRQSQQAGGLASLPLSDPRVVKLTDDLLPLADAIFTAPAAGNPSTARVLFDTLNDLSTQVPDWPARMAPLAVMHRIQPAIAVDFSQPATYTANGQTVDNRSSLHQLLDLLARADGCQIPFVNKSMAEMILDMMAGLNPQTVTTLTSLVTSLPGFIVNISCPGISNDVKSLDDLAKSGSLDALLPLAKVFKDRGETRLLVNLLVRVQQSYAGTLRTIEPDVNLILASGAVEELAALFGQATQITDPATGKRLADIIADSIATLVDQHASNVSNRRGQRVPSLAYLLLLPLRELDARLRAAGVQTDAELVLDATAQILLARTKDPITGQEVLANGSVVPFSAKVLSLASQYLPNDAATRRADVTSAQQSAAAALLSRDFGAVVTLLATIRKAPSQTLIDTALANALTPNPNASDDIFGAVVKLLAIGLQEAAVSKNASLSSLAQPLTDLAHFLGNAIDPQRSVVQHVIVGFTRILTTDRGKTVLGMMRVSMNPPAGSTVAPMTVLVRTFQEVEEAGARARGGASITQAQVASGLQQAIVLIRDPKGPLNQVFDVIRTRRKK